MKILLADLHKYVGYSGGIEHVLSDMANAMTARGHTVSAVFFDRKTGNPFFKMAPEVEIYNLLQPEGEKKKSTILFYRLAREIVRPFSQSLSRDMNYKGILALKKEMMDVIAKTKPDVIISFREPTGRLLLGAIQTDIPVISMLHNDPDEIFAKSPEKEKNALLRSRWIQVLIPSFINKAEKYLPYDRFVYIPNSVPVPQFKVDLCKNKETYIITNVGRVTGRTKRQHLLVEAFSRIANEYPEWNVHIRGAMYDKPYVTMLKRLINKKGMEKRIFLKGTTTDMDSVWKETDVFAFPSHHEGFPLALTEAMSVGLPAVGYKNCPAVNELIKNGENGFLAEDGIESFSEALKKIIENKSLRKQLGDNAAKSMELFYPDKVWDAWENLIKKTVGC